MIQKSRPIIHIRGGEMTETKPASMKYTLKWLFMSLWSQFKWLSINIAGAFFDSVLVILIAFYMREIIDTALMAHGGEKLASKIAVFAILVSASLVVMYVRTYSAGRISTNIMFDLRSHLYNHIERLPVSYMDKHHTGELFSSAINDVLKIENFINFKLGRALYIPPAFIITFSYMLSFRWNLLLVSLVVTPLVILGSMLIVRTIGQSTYKIQTIVGASNAVIQDAISGIHILKSYNLKNKFLDKYSKYVYEAFEKSLDIIRRSALISPLLHVLKQVPSLVCVVYGGYLIVIKQMSPGELLAFVYLLNILVGLIADIPDLIGEVIKLDGAYGHLKEILDSPVEGIFETKSECKGIYTEPLQNPDPICMHSVSFGYEGGKEIVKELSFTIKKGSITAFVGPSGGGKSTIFKLICGFYPPSGGTIEIFGTPISSKELLYIRSQISLVTQDAYLFPVSAAENISYGRPEAGMDEIIAAAKAANAHDFIMELPSGYDTMVGERGTRLSGGQKQRISIARAILKGAPILLFDEPTSALDNQSEALVQDALEKLRRDKTILIIAHRLSTIKNADEIIVINEGSLEEKGTHNQLMEKGGFYKQLYLKQFASNGIPE